jgi:SAM-dependent methyltransferase
MNKSALKKFATSLRIELIEQIDNKINYLLSLDIDNLPIVYKEHRASIQKISERYEKEQEDFIEEVAYIWFNRFVALRYMDVNAITEPMVVSPLEGQALPQIFNEAKNGIIAQELTLDRQKFYALIDRKIEAKDPENEAYKMLFIAVCNYYGKIMPFMFESIRDYTELLLPEEMLSQNSLRARTVEAMSREDCQDVEVIGWLYQFYISEKKDEVFAKLKKNQKITPSNIPAATQLFTPHWIVRYMVENSLGRLWMQNRPGSSLKEHMKYYIESDDTNDKTITLSSVEELTLLDPCCGSGHILTYAFDLLTKIYEEEGYSKSEIPTLILQNNLFGCDIDKRAASLANFALVMKARAYYRRFFRKNTKPNIIELQDFGSEEFAGIKNFGSLMKPKENELYEDGVFAVNSAQYQLQKRILSEEFCCVVTNPPYMGSKGMNKELSDFVKKRYPDSKSDLFAVFMERALEMTKEQGYMAMINQHSWMFLSSYEKLRVKIIKNHKIDTLVHLGARAFEEIGGEVVQSVAFVLQKGHR